MTERSVMFPEQLSYPSSVRKAMEHEIDKLQRAVERLDEHYKERRGGLIKRQEELRAELLRMFGPTNVEN